VTLLLPAGAARPRGPRVHLRARADREASEIEIIVRDDGVGISAAAAARATEPFFTTKPEGAGLGLGLAIASEIVKEHHGQLRLQPRAGRGTEAIVRLPIASREPLS
jgi:signal transduction histidine kinase